MSAWVHLLLNKRGARLKAAPKCAEGRIYAELRIPVEAKATLEVASSEPSVLHQQFAVRNDRPETAPLTDWAPHR